uniref:Uncharacterized protein n=1 Tax=Romanomermis culicivorax TaxID=13658 RepID=A0A915KV71_ROMCU
MAKMRTAVQKTMKNTMKPEKKCDNIVFIGRKKSTKSSPIINATDEIVKSSSEILPLDLEFSNFFQIFVVSIVFGFNILISLSDSKSRATAAKYVKTSISCLYVKKLVKLKSLVAEKYNLASVLRDVFDPDT